MFDILNLANNIKKYRKSKGLTQYELAEKLLISPQSVSKWECGLSVPDISNLCKISNILDVSIDMLIGNLAINEKVMIGIDGEDNRTVFVLFNESGKLLNRVILGGCNPNYFSIQTCCTILRHGIDTLMNITSKVNGIFIGASGFDCGNNSEIIYNELKAHYPNIKIKCSTDIINVIASADMFNKNCIAATCSTGSVVYSYSDGKLSRFGGWGYMLENGGSAFGIGREALKVALGERETGSKHSLITEYSEKRLGSGVWESLPKIYEKGQYFVATFASEVFKAFDQGDKTAKKILEQCAEYMANRITNASKSTPHIKTLVISGSLIESSDSYLQILKEKLPDWLDIIVPELPSVYGACAMCCKMCGIDTVPLSNGFILQYGNLPNNEQ